MYKKPSSKYRHVTLDIETVSTHPEEPKGALSALTGRVACICMLVDDGVQLLEYSFAEENEATLLREFWEQIRPNDLFIGHNALEFDLTFIRQRSMVNGILPSREIDLRRFYSHDVVDTMHLWSNWGSTTRPSLDGLADLFGFAGKTGCGSQVADWWASGDLASISLYCQEDVRLTYQVYLRLMLQPIPERFENLPPLVSVNWDGEVIVHSRDVGAHSRD